MVLWRVFAGLRIISCKKNGIIRCSAILKCISADLRIISNKRNQFIRSPTILKCLSTKPRIIQFQTKLIYTHSCDSTTSSFLLSVFFSEKNRQRITNGCSTRFFAHLMPQWRIRRCTTLHNVVQVMRISGSLSSISSIRITVLNDTKKYHASFTGMSIYILQS